MDRIPSGGVWALDADDTVCTLCELDDEPLGLGWTADGDLLIACQQTRQLMRLHDGELSVAADLSKHVANPLNDLLVDDRGRALVGDFGFAVAPGSAVEPTALRAVSADGSVTELAQDLVFPNGMAITADNTLLVAETWAYRISAFDLQLDGSLANRRTWAQFRDAPAQTWDEVLTIREIAPDAICLDAEGALWIGDAIGHCAHRVLPGSEIVESIKVGEDTAFAVELGGEDGRTLYIGGAPHLSTGLGAERRGKLWQARVDVPGAAFV
jgi:sugar lactone lactonase YvrE